MTQLDRSDGRQTSAAQAEPPQDRARRLEFLGLGEEEASQLRAILPQFRTWADEFVETFYQHLFSFDETARFLRDPALVERLKVMQREHLASMLEARWDDAYVQRRHKVGQAHAEVGIEPQFFLGAYVQYVQFALERLAHGGDAEMDRFKQQTLALLKAVFLDIGLTLDAYFGQLTQNLRQALDMFWKANTELRQFAHLTSHDLKTPLATVANLCDEALDEFGDAMPPASRQLIAAARARTFRMSRMIDDLLASAILPEGVQANGEESSQTAFEEALDLVRPLLDKNNIEINVPASFPWVWGNKLRLREAFVNLLSNAAKFIDKRPGRIDVQIECNDQFCLFIVADNGPGIPTEELERIFVPFRRLPMHGSRPGSGLGLYFTRNLITQQGGRIWAESTPDKGSRFYIQLRRAAPPSLEKA